MLGPRGTGGRQGERITLLAGHEQQAEVAGQRQAPDHGQLRFARADVEPELPGQGAADHRHPVRAAGQQDGVRPFGGRLDGLAGELDDAAEQVRGHLLQPCTVDAHVALGARSRQPTRRRIGVAQLYPQPLGGLKGAGVRHAVGSGEEFTRQRLIPAGTADRVPGRPQMVTSRPLIRSTVTSIAVPPSVGDDGDVVDAVGDRAVVQRHRDRLGDDPRHGQPGRRGRPAQRHRVVDRDRQAEDDRRDVAAARRGPCAGPRPGAGSRPPPPATRTGRESTARSR